MADGTIRVAVRGRPIMISEAACPKADIQYYGKDPSISVNGRVFTYDYVFPPTLTTSDIYRQAISNQLQHVFEGYNVTIMAFGQTGSGKTFTMGTNHSCDRIYNDYELGIMPRGIEDVFYGIQRRSNEANFVVKVSFVEIYGEDIFDLLSNRRDALSIGKIGKDALATKVASLTAVTVPTEKEALQMLERGSRARTTASTAMNEKSSRSHAVYTIHVVQTKSPACVLSSKFQMVDLAGSERAEDSGAGGLRFREGININLGLLALGNVINALAERHAYIPYRDSKLTRLLSDSLGGNSVTIIIACISPVDSFQTMKTLHYAGRALKIKNKPKLNVDTPELEVEKLKEQITNLQEQICIMQMSGNVSGPSNAGSVDLIVKYENLRNELQSSSSRITELTQKLIEAEDKVEKFESFKIKVEVLCTKIEFIIGKSSTEEMLEEFSNILEEVKEIEFLCIDLTDFAYRPVKIPTEPQVSPVISEESEIPEETEYGTDSDSEQEGDCEQSSDEITRKSCNIGQEIDKIEESLNRKNEEIKQIETMSCVWEIPGCQQEDINDMLNKIKVLEKEREELAEALKISEKNLLDERQKKYNQCQKEIKHLEAEVVKSQTILNMKSKHKEKVEELKTEILTLKQAKVKLFKKIKEEGNSFRKMQRAKDKEVAQLKQKDRKKDIEFAKKSNQFEKQINVLKSRVDKANAYTENLKKALQKKDACVNAAKSKVIDPKKVKQWIEQEVDIAVCQQFVNDQYHNAKENADALEEQLQFFEETADKLLGSELKENFRLGLEAHKKNISELKVTSQNKAGNKKTNIWDKISTMAEAKPGLDFLFHKCISAEVSVAKQRDELNEMQTFMNRKYEEDVKKLHSNIETLQVKMEAMKNEYEERIFEQDREYKKKTLEYLKQMSQLHPACLESSSSNLQEKLAFQEAEIAKLSTFSEDYEKKCKEVEALQQRLLKAKRGKNIKWLGDITSSSRCDINRDTQNKTSSMLKEYLFDDCLEDSFVSQNDENDPDWRATPLRERRKRPMRVLDSEQNILQDSSASGDSDIPTKRSFSGCHCPGDCRTMRCGCKKRDTLCNVSCSCNQERCMNKLHIQASQESLTGK